VVQDPQPEVFAVRGSEKFFGREREVDPEMAASPWVRNILNMGGRNTSLLPLCFWI
jgi:hypothetical protein